MNFRKYEKANSPKIYHYMLLINRKFRLCYWATFTELGFI
jgi:hypothetical protein